jgi:hypothetical protein
MPESTLVAKHYTHGSLVDAISRGIQAIGKTADTVDIDDLGPVDEFHITMSWMLGADLVALVDSLPISMVVE